MGSPSVPPLQPPVLPPLAGPLGLPLPGGLAQPPAVLAPAGKTLHPDLWCLRMRARGISAKTAARAAARVAAAQEAQSELDNALPPLSPEVVSRRKGNLWHVLGSDVGQFWQAHAEKDLLALQTPDPQAKLCCRQWKWQLRQFRKALWSFRERICAESQLQRGSPPNFSGEDGGAKFDAS